MDIDVSKENIQPLRGGRNLMQLGAALQAQSDVDAQKQLQQQKEEHEAAIRNYQGTDPLDPWFNYIQWVEQSFPKHGHEGNIDKLVKDCLQLFEKDERYFQDRRLVKLWIKYVDCLSNPLEIYQRLYNTGIGVECSEFYRAWACYCEESGDYKKANQVYMLGLQAKAQPIDELEQAHMNFQLFFAQRMLHDDSPTKRKAASALAETRMALTSLKSFKRRNIANVPVQRIGESIKSTIPGVVRQQPNHYDNRMPNSNVIVNVFEDAPSTSHAIPVVENPGPASLVQACSNVENEREVGIWTNPKTKMVHTHLVPHQPLPFTPYEDEDDVLRLPAHHMSHCSDDLTFNVPLCVPDPPDPTKIPCYNKTHVYVDDYEYSLEEIRSRKYNLDKKVKTEYSSETKSQQSYQNINETLAQCSALETLANCALDTEHDHLGQLMPLTIPTLQNITKVTNMHSPGEPKVLVNLDSKEFSELSSKKSDEPHQDNNADKENIGRFSSDNYSNDHVAPKNNLMEEFNRSLMGNFLGDSVTVNTKEARWELRNLFNDNEPSMVQPVVQQFEVPNFDIHEDRSMTMSLVTKKKVEPMDIRGLPEDKENANKFTVPAAAPTQNVNRTAYYEEPSCTQVFNFNIKDASTPNMSQFKKPTSIDQSKYPNVPKFSMDESVIENLENGAAKKEDSSRQMNTDQHATVDNQGAGLSVIMEATREYNSKSGSTSSSGQSTRTNFTGYTTNFDSMYNHNDPSQQPTTSKRSSISSQPRLPSGQFARYPQKREPEKPVPPSAAAYTHDHQYQKPVSNNYNGYSPQRAVHTHYQQNFSYQQGYSNNQMMNQQPGYGSPNANTYSSPHTAVHSPHAMSPNLPNIPQGFQSPTYSNQVGYHSPVLSPQGSYGRQEYHYPSQSERQQVYAPQQQQQSERQQVYASQQQQQPERQQVYASQQQQQTERQQVYAPQQQQQSERQQVYAPQHQQPERQQAYAPPQQQQQPERQQAYAPQQQQQQSERQQVYAPQQQQQQPERQPVYAPQQQQQSERQQVYAPQQQQSPAFQSPPHQPQYQNNQYYQRPAQMPAPNQGYNQQTYPNMHNQYTNAYANPNSHPNQNQSINALQSPYRQSPKPENSPAAYATLNNKPFQIYQSPQQPQSYRNTAVQGANTSPETAESQAAQESHAHVVKQQETVANQNGSKLGSQTKNPAPHKSPTSALRHIRHDQPNAKLSQNSPDVGFSNQFLNFISNRNEPKDNANTPKFTNSPSISQKMHKNLYVSSPEQAQIPPSSGLSDSDSKDGMTAQTGTPIQSAKVAHSMPEKQKDISKRQLDFEHRVDLQSEDSRDSVSKESRISSVYSRQSDVQSDGFGMDVDSENSMECAAFKSMHSISLVETSDIPRPADIDFPKVIDPFNKKIISSLLEYVKFPNKTHAEGYIEVRSVPKLQPATMISIGNNKFSIEKQLGKGNYGAVFLCLDVHSNKSVAVKYQKPSRPWEFYICQEIKARIKDPFMLPGYMDITTAFIGENASLFVSEYCKYGSLLDVANKVRIATSKCINEFIVILLTSEMLSIVHYLHKAQIIHADIKPDNFLLMKIPTQEWRTPSLQLIDLGCAIDMSLFPEGTSFRELIATEGFTCTEMREGKPWTYQTDLYCLAGTIHVILMGSYMKVANRLGQWNIDKKLPRYMKVSLWDKIFTTLLNVQDCNSLPDIMDLKNEVDRELNQIDVIISSQLRNFANVLKSR